jgi:hypothetical protein
MARPTTVEHWYERNRIKNPAAVVSRRQRLRQTGRYYNSRRPVRRSRQQWEPGLFDVAVVLFVAMLAIPLIWVIQNNG